MVLLESTVWVKARRKSQRRVSGSALIAAATPCAVQRSRNVSRRAIPGSRIELHAFRPGIDGSPALRSEFAQCIVLSADPLQVQEQVTFASTQTSSSAAEAVRLLLNAAGCASRQQRKRDSGGRCRRADRISAMRAADQVPVLRVLQGRLPRRPTWKRFASIRRRHWTDVVQQAASLRAESLCARHGIGPSTDRACAMQESVQLSAFGCEKIPSPPR